MKIAKFFAGMVETARRFPVLTAGAVAAFVGGMLSVECWDSDAWGWVGGRLILTGTFAWLLGAALTMGLERTGRKGGWMQALLAAALAGAYFLFPDDPRWFVRVGYVRLLAAWPGALALLTLLMIRPDEKVGKAGDAGWAVLSGCVLGILVGGMLMGGLSLLTLSVDTLFGLHLDGDICGDLMAFCFLFATPLTVAQWLPRGGRLEAAPRWVQRVNRWTLTPLCVLYGGVLLAYLVRILCTGRGPNWSMVALPGLCFAAAGLPVWLLMRAGEERGGWERFYLRAFPWAMMAVSLVVLLSAWMRLSGYGVMPSREARLVIGAWLLASGLWFGLRPKASAWPMLAGFALGALLLAWGPWSMIPMTLKSQRARAEKILAANPPPSIDAGDAAELKKALQAVWNFGGMEHLPDAAQKVMEDRSKDGWRSYLPCDIVEKMGYQLPDNGMVSTEMKFKGAICLPEGYGQVRVLSRDDIWIAKRMTCGWALTYDGAVVAEAETAAWKERLQAKAEAAGWPKTLEATPEELSFDFEYGGKRMRATVCPVNVSQGGDCRLPYGGMTLLFEE